MNVVQLAETYAKTERPGDAYHMRFVMRNGNLYEGATRVAENNSVRMDIADPRKRSGARPLFFNIDDISTVEVKFLD